IDWVESHPGLDLVVAGSNLGYGGGANLGAVGAREPWLLVVNPDIVFRPGAIDALLDAAGRWPRAGVLGPRIITDGKLYPSARELPSLGRGIGHAIFGWVWPSNPWTAGYRREREEPRESRTGWLSGSCLLVRREAFEEVGGFDEAYFMYFEDTDLCQRLGQAGWDVVYAPDSVVDHHGGHSTASRRTAMSKVHHQSAYLYLSRAYPGPVYLPLRVVLRVGLWARYQVSRWVSRVGEGAQPTRRA
ncbi:MAG: glycosyltransferase family 2 protein, partial [Lapillicoccus sp.]